MFTVIFGKPDCPYCVTAKEKAEELKQTVDGFNYRYVDIVAEGISKEDLTRQAGKEVTTVPQIFVGREHIGGCDDFLAWVEKNNELAQ
ncbi:GrxA family glutaredoxin [Vibrio crassostreae]|uniref:GrxA family glutaredoxin n=1 Tax=Vibrio crassostreae TaxID=246167 RepID=UPI001B302C76|nr:GrxA family glutaredoxin [Vibrio crassostreae]